MKKSKKGFTVGSVEHKLMYLMGEDNYTKYKEEVCSKDKNKTLTVEDLIEGLSQCMYKSYYKEYMDEIALVERRIKDEYKDDPTLMKYYIKSVERLFELFGKGLDAKKSSHIYKVFKEFKAAIGKVVVILLHQDIYLSKLSPKERVFVFNNEVALIQVLFSKYPLESEWDLKTWEDITTGDIKVAAEKIFKKILNIA
jgi:hypothetical protein